MGEAIEITPSAARLTASLRDIGYSFVTALADIVDNSVTAGASRVEIAIRFHGRDSFVVISDNGSGMGPSALNEALRFGTRRSYRPGDLGRFGLGLKTASLSQARRLMVISRASRKNRRLHCRVLDIDRVERTDRWEVLAHSPNELAPELVEPLRNGPGTIVVWDRLDRVLDYADPGGAWAKRHLERLAAEASDYLAMVFHRFLEGVVEGRERLSIVINGSQLSPWDPFLRSSAGTKMLSGRTFPIRSEGKVYEVGWQPFVLPARNEFASQEDFDAAGGLGRWNRQQGIYAYREDRLLQAGGWCGIRTLDEHTKLARVSLDFGNDADHAFGVDVAKRRISLPADLKELLERPISTLCREAQARYRATESSDSSQLSKRSSAGSGDVAFSLRAAALAIGEEEALERIFGRIAKITPSFAQGLGVSANDP